MNALESTAPADARARGRGRAAAAAVALAAGLLLAGCGTAPGTAAPAPAPASPSAPAPVTGPIQVRTLSGSPLEVPAGKPTVLYFFTASCGDCSTGVKAVAGGLAKAATGAQAVAVDLDPSEPDPTLASFAQSVGNPPITFARDDGTLLKRFNVDALGLTVVLDPAGKEVYRGVDPTAEQVTRALAAARS